MAPLIQNTLFMDNIAANEGVRYEKDSSENRLRINVCLPESGTGECRPVQLRFHTNPLEDEEPQVSYSDDSFPYRASLYDASYRTYNPLKYDGVDPGNDVSVALPGPVGEHAFYAFLENLIRNAAKHNLSGLREPDNGGKRPNLEITVEVSEIEGDPDFYCARVWDNLTPASKVDDLRAHLEAPFLTDVGEMRREAWGIAEMKICAALLSGTTEWQSLQGSSVHDVCDVESIKRGGDKYVAYKFWMMKPKEAVMLLSEETTGELNSEYVATLQKSGIALCSNIRQLTDLMTSGAQTCTRASAASYKFAFMDVSGRSEEDVRQLAQLAHLFPFRLVAYVGQNKEALSWVRAHLPDALCTADRRTVDALTNGAENDDAENISLALWRTWIQRWKDAGDLHVFLQQNQDESPTKEWRALAEKWNEDDVRLGVWATDTMGAEAQNNVQPQIRNVLYDRHCELVASYKDDSHEANFKPGTKDAYLPLDKKNSDFISLTTTQPTEELAFQMLETGLLRILVVDERIAEVYRDVVDNDAARGGTQNVPSPFSPGDEFLRWHSSGLMNMPLCTHFSIVDDDGDIRPENAAPLHDEVEDDEPPYLKVQFGLKHDDDEHPVIGRIDLLCKGDGEDAIVLRASIFTEEGERVCEAHSTTGNGQQTPLSYDIDMIVIHQGIIDSHAKQLTGFSFERFVASLRTLIPFVVIDSGRGIPMEVQQAQGVKFLPYSLLSEYTTGSRIAKLRLSDVLMSLSRRKQI